MTSTRQSLKVVDGDTYFTERNTILGGNATELYRLCRSRD